MESDNFNKAVILCYMDAIKREMDASQMLYHVGTFLKPEDYSQIFNKLKSESGEAANEYMVNKLMEYGQNGWFQGLIDALTHSGFDTLAKRLTLQDVKNTGVYRELLRVAHKELMTVTPSDIVPYLVQKAILSDHDGEVICNSERQHSRLVGMQELLKRLPMRRETWFKELVMALRQIRHTGCLDILEPMLANADSEEEVTKTVEKVKKANSDEMSLCQSGLPYSEEVHESTVVYRGDGCKGDEVLAACNFDISPGLDDSGKNVDKSIKLSVAPVAASTSSCSAATDMYQETDVKILEPPLSRQQYVGNQLSCFGDEPGFSFLNLKEDREDTDCAYSTCSNNASAHSSTVEQSVLPGTDESPDVLVTGLPTDVTVEELVQHLSMVADVKINVNGLPAVKIVRDTATGQVLGSAHVSFRTAEDARNVIEIFSGHEFKNRCICIEYYKPVRQRGPSRQDVTRKPQLPMNIGSGDSQPSTGAPSNDMDGADAASGATANPPELNLRSYQKELAQKAIEGKNCIVVAPTGSGKTHVALAIVKRHFEKCLERRQPMSINKREGKAVFFVPTVALVEQQKKMFSTYLCNLKTRGLSGGDQGDNLAIETIIPHYDVFVMTPQIMENALSDAYYGADIMQSFSLLIFDECHHTNKNHPYNAIMSHYIDLVLENEEKQRPVNILPQVVGLTASVGVGKAKSVAMAIDHILKLCANLHCHEICTVSKNVADLAKNVNKPNEETNEIQGRVNDPFHKQVCGIMKQIEERMKTSPHAEGLIRDQPNILLAPRDRGSDRYTQWINGLEKPIAKIRDSNSRRFLVSCQRTLMVYNTGLLINADCRTVEALTYIDKQFNPANQDPSDAKSACDETDEWLRNLFEEAKNQLTAISRDPNNINPKLEFLKRIILEYYQGKEDSRGIIFVKTREMTVALVSWMTETEELKELNPHNLVGTNAPSMRAGQTPFKQDDVLKCFKDGKHKVIVATSVAEEGLDVQQCNWVIRYEHVTNATARIQSRGRARATNAEYRLVAEQGRGVADKEMVNKIHENMMRVAIQKIQNEMTPVEIQRKIREFQKSAKVEREMAARGKEIESKRRITDRTATGNAVFRCHKCDSFAAYSDDIRTIEKSLHVILDNTYERRVKIRPHPTPKEIKNVNLTGKVYCKQCGHEWGVMGVYNKVAFPIIQMKSFVIEGNGELNKYNFWKEYPIEIKPLSPDEMTKMVKDESADANSNEDDENDVFDVLSDNEEFGSMTN